MTKPVWHLGLDKSCRAVITVRLQQKWCVLKIDIHLRFQNHNVTAAGPHYYSHWLACQQHLGAANEDCRKLRWWAEAMTQNRSVSPLGTSFV